MYMKKLNAHFYWLIHFIYNLNLKFVFINCIYIMILYIINFFVFGLSARSQIDAQIVLKY